MIWISVTILFLLLMSAFFSGMEIAYVTSNKLKLEIEKNKKTFTGKLLHRITRNPEAFITTMLVGNNVVLVIYGIYTGDVLTRWIENRFGNLSEIQSLLLETFLSGLIILILAEFIPKIVFQIYSNTALKIFALPTYFIYQLLRPLSKAIIKISNAIVKIFDKNRSSSSETSLTKSELRKYLSRHMEGQNTDTETEPELQIFSNALNFGNVRARDIMVPRTEIVAIDLNDSNLQELEKLFKESGHSKIIAYEDNIDNIAGYIHFFDLFKKPKNIRQILRKIIMVPETEPVSDLLKKMIRKKKSIAVVFEEYGGTAGIVTLEDIMESLFGEIEDEHDPENNEEKQIDENTFIFSAKKNINEINDKYKLKLPEDADFESLGGYVLELFGRIPEPGETVEDEHFRYTVTKATDKNIEEIQVERKG